VTSFATAVAGTLSTASMTADLEGAVTALGANQAVMFTANAGDLNGHTFLIVDANGTTGYQAGGGLPDRNGHTGKPDRQHRDVYLAGRGRLDPRRGILMNEKWNVDAMGRNDSRSKRSWDKPELTRIEAGQAELGTRAAVSDGGFTTS